jgi:EpsI family protein
MTNAGGLLGSVARGLFVPVSVILVMQAAALHVLSIPERDLPIPGLHKLPLELGRWKAPGERILDTNITEYLRPDEYILRDYVDETTGAAINLFVAYFKSLQNTYGPHSPRVCLPGAGWLVRSSNIESVQVPGRAERIPVNEYVLEKSGNRILIVYWYQNDRNIWAEEFQAKLRLLPDLIKYKRSDVSLVRLITPMRGTTPESERPNSVEFVRSIFPILVQSFSSAK